MKEIRFRCNICGTVFETSQYVVGIYFGGKSEISEKEPMACENHICKSCLVLIYPLSKKAVSESETKA